MTPDRSAAPVLPSLWLQLPPACHPRAAQGARHVPSPQLCTPAHSWLLSSDLARGSPLCSEHTHKLLSTGTPAAGAAPGSPLPGLTAVWHIPPHTP